MEEWTTENCIWFGIGETGEGVLDPPWLDDFLAEDVEC